ncbi:MAG TPA: hypothetical protein VFX76_09950 [Roseiflexaceae bacterium]|nr:hypothetical protein [Roseiflexaceae bacterium]
MTITKPQTASLIDTFSEGYRAVNRRPWLIIVPILVNLYIWFGTQLSFEPLLVNLTDVLRLSVGATEAGSLQTQPLDGLRTLSVVDMRQFVAVLNYIPLTIYAFNQNGTGGGALSLPMALPVPQWLGADQTSMIVIDNVGGALLAFVVLNAVALPLSVAFLTSVAEAVRGDRTSAATWLRRMWRAVLALLGCIGILVGIGLALGLPFLFFATLLAWLSPAIAFVVLVLMWLALLWARIYLGFAREAIVISGVGPLRALHASFNIVRRNMMGTLGFLALSWLIAVGSGVLWLTLAQGSTVGLLVAIIGSAYLGSGLLAARMAFYRERLRRWQNSAVRVTR